MRLCKTDMNHEVPDFSSTPITPIPEQRGDFVAKLYQSADLTEFEFNERVMHALRAWKTVNRRTRILFRGGRQTLRTSTYNIDIRDLDLEEIGSLAALPTPNVGEVMLLEINPDEEEEPFELPEVAMEVKGMKDSFEQARVQAIEEPEHVVAYSYFIGYEGMVGLVSPAGFLTLLWFIGRNMIDVRTCMDRCYRRATGGTRSMIHQILGPWRT